jgi:hypothetical protein
MKKKSVMFVIILVAFILVASLFFAHHIYYSVCSYICENELVLVPESEYKVSIAESQGATGTLYYLGRDNYLLTLYGREHQHTEGYFLNFRQKDIGLPDFGRFRRLIKFALVERNTMAGFPYLGTLDAEWKVSANENEVRIRIKGSPDTVRKANGFVSTQEAEEYEKKDLALAYQKEIILTK